MCMKSLLNERPLSKWQMLVQKVDQWLREPDWQRRLENVSADCARDPQRAAMFRRALEHVLFCSMKFFCRRSLGGCGGATTAAIENLVHGSCANCHPSNYSNCRPAPTTIHHSRSRSSNCRSSHWRCGADRARSRSSHWLPSAGASRRRFARGGSSRSCSADRLLEGASTGAALSMRCTSVGHSKCQWPQVH